MFSTSVQGMPISSHVDISASSVVLRILDVLAVMPLSCCFHDHQSSVEICLPSSNLDYDHYGLLLPWFVSAFESPHRFSCLDSMLVSTFLTVLLMSC